MFSLLKYCFKFPGYRIHLRPTAGIKLNYLCLLNVVCIAGMMERMLRRHIDVKKWVQNLKVTLRIMCFLDTRGPWGRDQSWVPLQQNHWHCSKIQKGLRRLQSKQFKTRFNTVQVTSPCSSQCEWFPHISPGGTFSSTTCMIASPLHYVCMHPVISHKFMGF